MFLSCDDVPVVNKEDAEFIDEYYEFQDFNLSSYELPAIISLPDETANIGAATKPEIIHTESDYQWDLKVGRNFEIHIEDCAEVGDLVKEKKKELANHTFYKIKYLIEDKELIMYERTLVVSGMDNASPTVGIEHKSYHVYGQKKLGKIYYELRSRDEGSDKTIIDLMVKSIRSLRPSEIQ
tara:strand:+ start:822 stop:1364 length:543 start_codon:yes stop_codon:yes gene_type:complete